MRLALGARSSLLWKMASDLLGYCSVLSPISSKWQKFRLKRGTRCPSVYFLQLCDRLTKKKKIIYILINQMESALGASGGRRESLIEKVKSNFLRHKCRWIPIPTRRIHHRGGLGWGCRVGCGSNNMWRCDNIETSGLIDRYMLRVGTLPLSF